MAGSGYEIFALLMRYVFVALGALILIRAFLWLRKDARAYRREIRNLPDAGLVGEMVDTYTGQQYPLPREGVLGSGRGCDICVRGGVMDRRALRFLFVDGKGLAITAQGRQRIVLDGHVIRGTGYALHGTRLEVGGVMLRVRLFAGLNVPRRVLYDEDGMQLMGDESEVSPFEEVAGMFDQGYAQDEQIADETEFNPFLDYDPLQNEIVCPMPDEVLRPFQWDEPQDGAVQAEPDDPWAQQSAPPPQPQAPLRHRRGDRYL